MLPSPQDWNKPPYNAKRKASQSRGRMEAVTCKASLPLLDTSALCVQLQLIELSLIKLIHCHLCWQNRVEIIALPLHSILIEILTMLHRDEPCIQENADTFHCGVLGHACLSGNAVVTGMTGVRSAILDQQQIRIDHERRGRKAQQKNFVRQSEKFSAVDILESGNILFGDEFSANQTGQIFFTVPTVRWAPFAIISGDRPVSPW